MTKLLLSPAPVLGILALALAGVLVWPTSRPAPDLPALEIQMEQTDRILKEGQQFLAEAEAYMKAYPALPMPQRNPPPPSAIIAGAR